ncbi:MAG: DUF6569 family protein [bacterium]
MKTSLNRYLVIPALLVGAILFCCQLIGAASNESQAGAPEPVTGPAQGVSTLPMDDYRLSGPYIHENLTLFLVHGEDKLKGDNIITLAEAMAQDKVVVYETGDVNELAIENISVDVSIFVLSGDIVKGGQQDRTIKYDIILEPGSGRVPIAAHCVESGRWHGRGDEEVAEFAVSTKQLASLEAKLGNRSAPGDGGGQSAVWGAVEAIQEKLGGMLHKSVRAPESASSLQLTLEDDDLNASLDEYQNALQGIVASAGDVVGYAFAINGELNSADLFANRELFRKVWPRLLEAAATEAISEGQVRQSPARVTLVDVRDMLLNVGRAAGDSRMVTDRVEEVTRENDEVILFETRDKNNDEVPLRRNYLVK